MSGALFLFFAHEARNFILNVIEQVGVIGTASLEFEGY
jgi:hypothetical protein